MFFKYVTAFFLFLSYAPLSFAADDFQVSIVVYFAAEEAKQNWQAKAIQESFKGAISGVKKIRLVETPGVFSECSEQECFLDKAQELSIDFVALGEWSNQKISYELFEVGTQAVITSKTISRNKLDGSHLQVAALQMMRPLIRHDGLVEQKELQLYEAPAFELPGRIGKLFPYQNIVLGLVGGLAWGFVILLLGSFIFGTLYGIQRIMHFNLSNVLKSWAETTMAKTILVSVFLLPTFLICAFYFPRLDYTPLVIWFLLFPVFTLLQITAFCGVNFGLTKHLDKKFLEDEQSKIWADAIKKYFIGYYKRLGIALPLSLIDKVDFYPASTRRPLMYGGGFTNVRALIPSYMVRFALGEPDISDEDNTDRVPQASKEMLSVIHPTKSGLVKKLKSENAADAFTEADDDHEDYAVLESELNADDTPEFFGQTAGVWGYILPMRKEESVPLISDNSQDLEIVEELLTEHHVHFAKAQVDEEFDDTDATDFDFLYGILVHQLGSAHRKDHFVSTLVIWCQQNIDATKYKWLKYYMKAYTFIRNHYSKYHIFLADSYAVFNSARHHLAQSLFYRLTGQRRLLTQRADRYELLDVSREIFDWLEKHPDLRRDEFSHKDTLRNRVRWLSTFFAQPNSQITRHSSFRWTSWLIAIVLAATVGFESYRAYVYNPVYTQRMEDLKKDIEEYKKEHQEKENGTKK